jgi:tRNA threonylcarbamoyladenosine modification (KEOPS) complex  Pcc1 subunit
MMLGADLSVENGDIRQTKSTKYFLGLRRHISEEGSGSLDVKHGLCFGENRSIDPLKTAKAEFSIVYRSAQEAKSIVKSISPDNVKAPFGSIVKAIRKGKRITIEISCIRGVETLLSTIDDLLLCVQVAEGVLRAVGELR